MIIISLTLFLIITNEKIKPTLSHTSMKKILIPTDFSAQAYNAIKVGVNLAKKANAEIILLHILDLPQSGSDEISKGTPAPEVMFFKNAAEAKLNQISLDPIFEGLTVYTSLILDRTALGVTKSATNNSADLIVMGSHGTSGLKDYFVGSNTEKVVRYSNVPVFVVKGDVTDFNLTDIIYASDFADSSQDIFEKTVAFAKLLDAKLHLLSVNTPNGFRPTHVAEEQLENYLKECQNKDFKLNIYNDISIEKGILNFAKTVNADLIALATHGRKGMSLFLNGSISEDLVNRSPLHVMTFKKD